MKIVPVDAGDPRQRRVAAALGRAWPEIVMHDAISNANWGRLYEERPEFQFALVDERPRAGRGQLDPGRRDARHLA